MREEGKMMMAALNEEELENKAMHEARCANVFRNNPRFTHPGPSKAKRKKSPRELGMQGRRGGSNKKGIS